MSIDLIFAVQKALTSLKYTEVMSLTPSFEGVLLFNADLSFLQKVDCIFDELGVSKMFQKHLLHQVCSDRFPEYLMCAATVLYSQQLRMEHFDDFQCMDNKLSDEHVCLMTVHFSCVP